MHKNKTVEFLASEENSLLRNRLNKNEFQKFRVGNEEDFTKLATREEVNRSVGQRRMNREREREQSDFPPPAAAASCLISAAAA